MTVCTVRLKRSQLVEHQRQNNRRGEAPQDRIQTDEERIAQYAEEIVIAEELLKVFKPHPLAARKAERGLVVLKGDDQAVHRLVAEQNQIDDDGDHQYIFPLVALKVAGDACAERSASGGLHNAFSSFLIM